MTKAKFKEKVHIGEDGLRYISKPGGSPFPVSQHGIGNTRSCFKCGVHRPAAEMESKKFLGKNQMVCLGGCKK